MQTSSAAPRRASVDHWPVPESGLSPRVVHCLETANVKTVGELRPWKDEQLMALRHFGIVSLDNVKWFFRWCRKIETGTVEMPNLRVLMSEFLNKQEQFVLQQRYGLTDPLFRPNMRRKTLQEIANMLGGMTRERVRQVEEEGLRNLRSLLCRHLAAPLEAEWASRIQARGGVVTTAELGEWAGDARLGGFQPWGAMLLFSEFNESIHFHFDYFSTFTPKALGTIESRVFEILRNSKTLVPFATVREGVQDLVNDPHGQVVRLLTVLLDHHPDIAGTKDGRYFLPEIGVPQVVTDILRAEASPLHFHDLTRLFNERMLENSTRGTGYLLRVLNMMPQVERVSRAVYAMKPAE